jgi:hypothetical protein
LSVVVVCIVVASFNVDIVVDLYFVVEIVENLNLVGYIVDC